MADQTLLMLARDVRGKTFKLLADVSEAEARFAPPGLSNTLLWHAGHALIVNEHMGVAPATGQPPVYPQGWFEIFSWKSQPALVKSWPSLVEVMEKLKDQLARLTDIIERASENELSRILDPNRGRSLRWSIMHGLHDEANHQGEMWLLRKLYAKRAI